MLVMKYECNGCSCRVWHLPITFNHSCTLIYEYLMDLCILSFVVKIASVELTLDVVDARRVFSYEYLMILQLARQKLSKHFWKWLYFLQLEATYFKDFASLQKVHLLFSVVEIVPISPSVLGFKYLSTYDTVIRLDHAKSTTLVSKSAVDITLRLYMILTIDVMLMPYLQFSRAFLGMIRCQCLNDLMVDQF